MFVLGLVAVEWPFANFLMTKAQRTVSSRPAIHDYGIPSWSAEVTRHFVNPEHGLALWSGLRMAMVYSRHQRLAGTGAGRLDAKDTAMKALRCFLDRLPCGTLRDSRPTPTSAVPTSTPKDRRVLTSFRL